MLSLTRKETWTAIGLSLAFCVTRLTNLRLWPIFTDEAIYARWSQIALHDASLRFIPLTDGKQPLWHWFTMSAMKAISDPLIAGRLVSAIAGFGALVGIWFLAYELCGKKKTAFLASGLYLITPFTFLYDRMALVESMLTMWVIWALFLAVKTARKLRLDYAILTGFAIGAGLLTKSPAIFLQYLYPLNLLFISRKKDIPRWILLTIPTMIIAEGMRNIMRLSPWMHMIGRKNLEFIMSYSEFFKTPFKWFWGNLPSLWRWWVGSLTWPIMLVSIVGFALVLLPKDHPLSLRKIRNAAIFLLINATFPFLIAAAFGKVIFARYLLFVTPHLLIMAAAAAERVTSLAKKREAKIVFALFIIVAAFYMDFKILTDPIGAPIISADRDQYVDGFPAGWGIDEVIEFLKNESKSQKIFLGTQGTFGLMPASFELYLWDNPNIEIHGYWPVSKVPDEVAEKAAEKPTYFIYYESNEDQIPPQDNIELVEKYKKGKSERFMYFYKVLPSDQK
jgi:hypothetical protein